jgi:ZIP family zinc transporter
VVISARCSRRSGGVAVIVAVFLSNVPESISASNDLRGDGQTERILWTGVVITSTLASGLGYVLLKDSSGDWIAAIQAFAAGAILTMLSDEMIPEAFEYSDHNKIVGLAVALGFALSAALSFSD